MGTDDAGTTRDRWLEEVWPLVMRHLPPAPSRILEVGCGEAGGFVPQLRSNGFAPLGVDPAAPDGPDYLPTRLEDATLPAGGFDAGLACTSLHHVDDPAAVIDRLCGQLRPGAPLIVIEWSWEDFDRQTALWCFDRLPPEPVDPPGWLERHRDRWAESDDSWEDYQRRWAAEESMHSSTSIVAELDARLERVVHEPVPYYFSDLAGTTLADEAAAIREGKVRANGLLYVGALPGGPSPTAGSHLRAHLAPGWLACRIATRHVINGIWDSRGTPISQSSHAGAPRTSVLPLGALGRRRPSATTT